MQSRLAGQRGVMFRLLRSSYEKVEIENFWQSVLQFSRALTQHFGRKGIYQDLQWKRRERQSDREKEKRHFTAVCFMSSKFCLLRFLVSFERH